MLDDLIRSIVSKFVVAEEPDTEVPADDAGESFDLGDSGEAADMGDFDDAGEPDLGGDMGGGGGFPGGGGGDFDEGGDDPFAETEEGLIEETRNVFDNHPKPKDPFVPYDHVVNRWLGEKSKDLNKRYPIRDTDLNQTFHGD